jgi:hypothetical protein
MFMFVHVTKNGLLLQFVFCHKMESFYFVIGINIQSMHMQDAM